jgi:hypothetical protein
MGKLTVPACPSCLPFHPTQAVLPTVATSVQHSIPSRQVHCCHVQPTTEAQERNITDNKRSSTPYCLQGDSTWERTELRCSLGSKQGWLGVAFLQSEKPGRADLTVPLPSMQIRLTLRQGACCKLGHAMFACRSSPKQHQELGWVVLSCR